MTMLRNRKLGFTKISKSHDFEVLLNVFNSFLCQKFSEKQTLQSYPLETLKYTRSIGTADLLKISAL